ncbi:hypothetical protein ACET3Z_011835 [Daucus carota]
MNASANESVSVTMTSVKQANAHAPTGNGLKMSPEIVVRKIARSCHACVVTREGFGTAKRTRRPMEIDNMSGSNFGWRARKVRKLERGGGVCGGVRGIVMMELSSTEGGDAGAAVEEVCISYGICNCVRVGGVFNRGNGIQDVRLCFK